MRDAARRYLDKRHSVTGYLVKDGAPREEKKLVIKLAAAVLAAASDACVRRRRAAPPARSSAIVSPGGIKAWLVREQSVPMVAIDFAFLGGANADPADKPGVASMVSSLLDEGAGELDARAFQERMEEKAIQLGFTAGRDHFRGSLRSLSANLDEAVDLLRLALTAPRFDAEPVERSATRCWRI